MVFYWWLLIALGLGIVEMLSLDLFFLMLAISALAGGIASAAGGETGVQVAVFAVASLLLLVLVRPWAKAHLTRTNPNIRTNAQGLIGTDALTLTRVNRIDGRAKVAGDTWSARSADGREIPAGGPAHVVRIDGATAIIERNEPPMQ